MRLTLTQYLIFYNKYNVICNAKLMLCDLLSIDINDSPVNVETLLKQMTSNTRRMWPTYEESVIIGL